MQTLPHILEVSGQEVVVMPDPAHEFTATTEQVALGYGVSAENIRSHKLTKSDELVEGKHWLAVGNTNARPGHGAQAQTLWTKRGIVRLGFFIRSKRARLFRDMAEDLVISEVEKGLTISAQPEALISIREVMAATGQTRNAANNYLRRYARVRPVAHTLDPRCHQPAFLFPMAEVIEAYVSRGWEGLTFKAFAGEVRPSTTAVEARAKRSVLGRGGKPAPLSLPTSRTNLAQELVRLETRRAEILAALA